MSIVREMKYYGVHACLMLAEKRLDSIKRLYLEESHIENFKPLLHKLAKKKIAYRVVAPADLEKISGSIHHEGVCIVSEEILPIEERDFLASLQKLPTQCCLLYLDGVENPHNLGSILRTSAHFGIPYILGSSLPSVSASCCRIAKGGGEVVRLVKVNNMKKVITALRNEGFELWATSAHQGKPLNKVVFSKRSILAIGAESIGLSKDLMRAAIGSVQIPGTGLMESLNVAVAAGICMGAYAFQHGTS